MREQHLWRLLLVFLMGIVHISHIELMIINPSSRGTLQTHGGILRNHIIMRREETSSLSSHINSLPFSQRRYSRAATGKPLKIWPDGEVPFVIDTSLDKQRSLIFRAMNQFHQHTCLRFVVRRADEWSYLHLSKQNRCWSSSVGFDEAKGRVNISLGKGCYHLGIVVHELGHALGLIHEHQRPDRDNYVEVNELAIQVNYTDQFATMSSINLSEYDYYSVMHYHKLAFTEKGLPTILPRRAVKLLPVGRKPGLSNDDIRALNRLYNCTE